MDTQDLVERFRTFDENGRLQHSKKVISSKDNVGRVLPPYVPFVGRQYDEHRILVYGTAQNISIGNGMLDYYSQHPDKMVERLYWNYDFSNKYPAEGWSFQNVAIAPYQEGILPALVGLYIHVHCGICLEDFNEVQECLAVTNYYKYSLHFSQRDLHPESELATTKINYKHYWELNNQLVQMELDYLQPDIILSLRRQNHAVWDNHGAYKAVNDPSWIKQGGGGVLSDEGAWGKIAQKAKEQYPNGSELIAKYIENIKSISGEPYKGKEEAVRIYLSKYLFDWNSELEQ